MVLLFGMKLLVLNSIENKSNNREGGIVFREYIYSLWLPKM